MTRRARLLAVLAVAAVAARFLPYALYHWSPLGWEALGAELLVLVTFWRCAYLNDQERTEGEAP